MNDFLIKKKKIKNKKAKAIIATRPKMTNNFKNYIGIVICYYVEDI